MELFWNFFPRWRRTDETADGLKNYVYGFPARVRVFGSQKSVFKVDVDKSCHCRFVSSLRQHVACIPGRCVVWLAFI